MEIVGIDSFAVFFVKLAGTLARGRFTASVALKRRRSYGPDK